MRAGAECATIRNLAKGQAGQTPIAGRNALHIA